MRLSTAMSDVTTSDHILCSWSVSATAMVLSTGVACACFPVRLDGEAAIAAFAILLSGAFLAVSVLGIVLCLGLHRAQMSMKIDSQIVV